MLERLEHGFLSQRQFIENLAHELKTPLAVMKGELEVTIKKMRSTQEYESTLRSSLEEVNRIIKILEDLLVLARLDRSVVILDMKPIDLGFLAESAIKDIKILAEQKNIYINFSTQGEIVVNGDENKIKHLFLNILDNALKYTLPGGKVSVEIGQEDNEAKITFADEGIGIAGNDLPHIFNRFFRGDKARSNSSFGLGLSIAKSIVEVHKGRIEVESELNKGSTFIIFLPLASRP
jgi:signal transduction histidine kinase